MGPSIAGFLLVTCYAFCFGLAVSEELTKLSDESPAAAFLFDPTDGLIPTLVATVVGGLMVGILLMNGWVIVLSVILGVGLGAVGGAIAFAARALSRRDLSKEDPNGNGDEGES